MKVELVVMLVKFNGEDVVAFGEFIFKGEKNCFNFPFFPLILFGVMISKIGLSKTFDSFK